LSSFRPSTGKLGCESTLTPGAAERGKHEQEKTASALLLLSAAQGWIFTQRLSFLDKGRNRSCAVCVSSLERLTGLSLWAVTGRLPGGHWAGSWTLVSSKRCELSELGD
jgi:hypothetical protein